MARTNWTENKFYSGEHLSQTVYTSRCGRVAVKGKGRSWSVYVDDVYVGCWQRCWVAKQYGLEYRDGLHTDFSSCSGRCDGGE
jgi:hypothetical protein